jgi:hypothetical protein
MADWRKSLILLFGEGERKEERGTSPSRFALPFVVKNQFLSAGKKKEKRGWRPS